MNATPQEWVVYREYVTRQVFTGITAVTREEVLEAWSFHGAGDLDPDREQQHVRLTAERTS